MSHQDRVFFSTFVGVLAFLVVLAFVFFFIAQGVSDLGGGDARMNDPMVQKAVEERIKPIGAVNVGEGTAVATAAPAAAAAPRAGKDIVAAACGACHTTGAAGAPKIGDKAAWDARFAQGMDTLVKNAVNGIRGMPPKGTCMDCSEDEIKAAIATMLTDTGFKVAAAAAPAAAPAPQAAAGDAGKGKQVFDTSCMACHATGAAGAPKVGDKAAWEPRIAQGMDTLMKHAVEGIRAMPPKGTCMTCSDADLKAAVEYMVSQSK